MKRKINLIFTHRFTISSSSHVFFWLWISIWIISLQPKYVLFCISFIMGLLATCFLSFCLSEFIFISLSFFKNFFLKKNYGRNISFPLSILKMSRCHFIFSRLPCVWCKVNHHFYCFSLSVFKIFWLTFFFFSNLTVMHLCVFFSFEFLLFAICWIS